MMAQDGAAAGMHPPAAANDVVVSKDSARLLARVGANFHLADADAAGTEVCNGLDDDCDGAVDEGTPGSGAACTPGNYRLAPNSPCINAGITRAWMIGACDLVGQSRVSPRNQPVDMGAYELSFQGGLLMLR